MCNAPLLDWTFESLAVAGVNEVYVMCQSHFESIEQAIQSVALFIVIILRLNPTSHRKSKWSQPPSPLKIHAKYLPPAVKSFGDAIRQVDAQGIINGDFVLVSGDMVCNVRIDEMVKIHKERRKADKEVIMTVLVKEAAIDHRTR
jgi:translation initiation factor eIF-2B subunit epsilon